MHSLCHGVQYALKTLLLLVHSESYSPQCTLLAMECMPLIQFFSMHCPCHGYMPLIHLFCQCIVRVLPLNVLPYSIMCMPLIHFICWCIVGVIPLNALPLPWCACPQYTSFVGAQWEFWHSMHSLCHGVYAFNTLLFLLHSGSYSSQCTPFAMDHGVYALNTLFVLVRSRRYSSQFTPFETVCSMPLIHFLCWCVVGAIPLNALPLAQCVCP